jgi:hypothetical protein
MRATLSQYYVIHPVVLFDSLRNFSYIYANDARDTYAENKRDTNTTMTRENGHKRQSEGEDGAGSRFLDQ